MTLSEIAGLPVVKKTAGLTNDKLIIKNVATDGRKCEPNSLFVCIKGQNVDGHDYVNQAVACGACAILAEKELQGVGIPVFIVDDSIKALGAIAHHWRRKTRATVIGVTGSAGKTTLKDALFQILSKHAKCAKSRLNHNNQIGLPLSMLAASGDEKYWIMEVGISRAGDMDELGAILRPDLAVILNVGAAHLEGLGEAGVARHKARLLNYVSGKGQALICGDYADLVRECGEYKTQRSSFFVLPVKNDEQYRLAEMDDGAGRATFIINGNKCSARLPLPGRAGAEIALAALACASSLGVSEMTAACALDAAELPQQRFNEYLIRAWRIIDDSYNANPLSMQRMLESAKEKASSNGVPLFLILGEMGELGEESPSLHEELGRNLAHLQPEFILYKGSYFNEVKQGLHEISPQYQNILRIDDDRDLGKSLSSNIFRPEFAKNGGVVLIKGSRANRLETVFDEIKELLN